jgi:hypothetical protein
MPRLPDYTALGPRPVPTPQRSIVGYNGGVIGQAMESAGNDIHQQGLQAQEKQDRFDLERAKTYFLTSQVEAKNALQDDQDFQTYEKRYSSAMAKARQDAMALISNPEHQQLFDLESQADYTRGLEDVRNEVRAKQKDFGRATLATTLDGARKAALSSSDPTTGMKLIQTSNGLIQGAYDRGYLSAEDAVKVRQAYAEDYAENWLKMQPLDQQLKLLTAGKEVQGPPMPDLPVNAKEAGSEEQAAKNAVINAERKKGATSTGPVVLGPAMTTADAVINHVIDKFEGTSLVADDAGRGPSKFGINQGANDDVDVKNLTRPQAVQLYKDRYWNAVGADQLPDNMKLAAFDTAVNFGPPKAKAMLAEANGDLGALVQLRKDEHARLIAADPGKYGAYKNAWEDRDNALAGGSPALKTGTPIDYLPPDKKAEWISKLPGLIKAQKEAEQSAALDDIQPIIQANNGDWTAVPADKRARAIKAGVWDKAVQWKGASDPDLVVDLTAMPPELLSKIDFNDPNIKSRLSIEDRKGFEKRAEDFREKPEEADQQQMQHDIVKGVFERLALDTTGDKGLKNRKRMAVFDSLLQAKIDVLRKSGKRPSRQEIQDLADGLIMDQNPVNAPQHWWNSPKPVYDTVVPEDERATIVTKLQQRGMPVTEGEILRLYLTKQEKNAAKEDTAP